MPTSPYRPGRPVRTGRRHPLTTASWAVAYGFLAYLALTKIGPGNNRTLAIVAIVSLPFLLTTIRQRIINRYDVHCRASLALLHQGHAARAEKDFALLEQRFRWPGFLSRLSGYNRALSLFRLGRLDDAIATLASADRRGGAPGIQGAIAGTLSYLYALRGDVELAEDWLREAQRRDRGLIVPGHAYLLPQLAIELRTGAASAILGQLADRWAELESTMKGESLRPLRVLRAFGVARAGGVRESGAAAPLLAALKPVRPDELAYLGVAWPELDQFIRTSLG
jgi:tetratricopeptide (TPR) repeat protein